MKIAITSTFLGHLARGVETWALDLSAELHRRGINVTLFKGGGTPTTPYERQVACADHTKLFWKLVTRVTRHGGWRFGLANPMMVQHTTFGLQMIRPLRQGNFDVVHMQDAWVARVLERVRRMGLHRAKVILGHGTEESMDYLLRLKHVQELAPYYLERDRNGETAVGKAVAGQRVAEFFPLEAMQRATLDLYRTMKA